MPAAAAAVTVNLENRSSSQVRGQAGRPWITDEQHAGMRRTETALLLLRCAAAMLHRMVLLLRPAAAAAARDRARRGRAARAARVARPQGKATGVEAPHPPAEALSWWCSAAGLVGAPSPRLRNAQPHAAGGDDATAVSVCTPRPGVLLCALALTGASSVSRTSPLVPANVAQSSPL
jgi:hypothetical protein